MKPIPILKTQHLRIRLLIPDDFTLLVDYQNKNKKHLSQWEPSRALAYFSPDETKLRAKNSLKQFQQGTAVTLIAFHHKDKAKIIALCTF